MNYEVSIKVLPEFIVYYKEGCLKKYSDGATLILSSADECLKDNPNIKCVEPDYCFMEYLDNEYKEENIHTRYSQAVLKAGKENETIKFRKIKETKAICILYKGHYDNIGDAGGICVSYNLIYGQPGMPLDVIGVIIAGNFLWSNISTRLGMLIKRLDIVDLSFREKEINEYLG